jgi:hypothetical protein
MTDFDKMWNRRPLKGASGQCGYNNCWWLFHIAKWLNPSYILESGTYKGWSAWVLKQACPAAEIETFDPVDRKGIRADGVAYRHYDFVERVELHREPEVHKTTLCFIDDHVSHELRLITLYELGFRYLILDDNLPPDEVEQRKRPPRPTLQEMAASNSPTMDIVRSWEVLPQLTDEKPTYLTWVELA